MACRELRRKIPFFIAATLDTLKIISPTTGQHISTDTNFYTEVKVPKGGGKKVYVYMGDYFLGSFSAVYTPSSGNLVIPNNILGIGTTFLIVDGAEVPVGNTKNVTLTYRTKKYSANVSVVAEGNKHFDFGTATGEITAPKPDKNPFDFGTASGEIDMPSPELNPFDFGSAKGSIY